MDPFFTAAADCADSRKVQMVFRRSEMSGEWEAVIILRDAYGKYEAIVRHLEPKVFKEGNKKVREDEEDFRTRVNTKIGECLVSAHRSRIGISFSSAQEADARVAA